MNKFIYENTFRARGKSVYLLTHGPCDMVYTLRRMNTLLFDSEIKCACVIQRCR